MIVMAGDIGGTNARLALYEVARGERLAFTPVFEKTYPSKSHGSLDEIAEAFLRTAEGETKGRVAKGKSIGGACFGIAGPIENNRCQATNLPWVVDGRSLAMRLGIERVTLINDFSA